MADYEVKTMQKDIEKTKGEGEPPEELPVALSDKLPGAPLPSEPTASTVLPELPELSRSVESEPVEPEPEISVKPRKKFFIPIILVIVILILGGGFYYWWHYLRGPAKPAIETPTSFITTERAEIINVQEGEEAVLFDELKKKADEFQEKDTFRRISVEKIGKEKNTFLSSQEIFKALAINLPANIVENLQEDNTLFLYSQEQGNRLGIIVKVNNADNLKNYLSSWEETMATDLKPLFLKEESSVQTGTSFSDNIYREITVRYLNFSSLSLSIDYAIAKDYLIITTSKESMYKVIDRILTP